MTDVGNGIVACSLRKTRRFPPETGSTSAGYLVLTSEIETEITESLRKIYNAGYRGLFDVEFIKANNKIYLNEINFRNSGIGSFSMSGKVFYPLIYVLDTCGKDSSSLNRKITKAYYCINEKSEILQWRKGNITFRELIKSLTCAKGKCFMFAKDPMPGLRVFAGYVLDFLRHMTRK